MSDEEIVERAIRSVPHKALAEIGYVKAITDAVVAALREEGRLPLRYDELGRVLSWRYCSDEDE